MSAIGRPSPLWVEASHRDYEGDDPWFVVRFAQVPERGEAEQLTKLFASHALAELGRAERDGRDLTLDFTDQDLERTYSGGYGGFVRDLEALVEALHRVSPIRFVLFQPDDDLRALDDDTLVALHERPEETTAALAGGDVPTRILAAYRAGALLARYPALAAGLLDDPVEDVRKATRSGLRRHFLWQVGNGPDAQIEAALRALRLPAIADAASYGLACALYREREAEVPRVARGLARLDGDPELQGPAAALVAGWIEEGRDGRGRATIATPTVAALLVLRARAAWASIVELGREALATTGERDDEDNALVTRLVDEAQARLT